jgi:protein gp37
MGQNSKIEWTHHTFNPWWGCVKVSKACDHCYAETWAKRVGADVCEKRADLDSSRERLWGLIEQTPNLDWLLLTKRPQYIQKMANL